MIDSKHTAVRTPYGFAVYDESGKHVGMIICERGTFRRTNYGPETIPKVKITIRRIHYWRGEL